MSNIIQQIIGIPANSQNTQAFDIADLVYDGEPDEFSGNPDYLQTAFANDNDIKAESNWYPADMGVMKVTGTLTDGTDPVTFPILLKTIDLGGKPSWEWPEESGYGVWWDSDEERWVLAHWAAVQSTWYSTADVDDPTLVPGGAYNATTNPTAWEPQGDATGTPVVAEADITLTLTAPAAWDDTLDSEIVLSDINFKLASDLGDQAVAVSDSGNKEITWTAVDKGADRNTGEVDEITIEVADPGADGATLDITVAGNVITIEPATTDGDAATATLDNGTEVTLTDAGAAGNDLEIEVVTPTIEVPEIGRTIPKPSQALDVSLAGDTITVLQATDAGTVATLKLTENSGFGGDVDISVKAAYAGEWADTIVEASIAYPTVPSTALAVVAEVVSNDLRISITLGSDADGDVIPVYSDALVIALNAAFVTAGVDAVFEATTSAVDVAQVETATAAGTIPGTKQVETITVALDAAVVKGTKQVETLTVVLDGAAVPGEYQVETATAVGTITSGTKQVETATAVGDITSGTKQVETATAVGAITGDGDATVTVTGALVGNSPKAIDFAVVNLDSTSDWATKCRTALNVADITTNYDIGGAGDDIVLTAKVEAADDATLNIALANKTCTGITDAATSVGTTPGVTPGTAKVVVTGALVGSSPKQFDVAVAKSDSPATWAGKVRTALDVTDITTNYDISGADAEIILTAKVEAADDGTLNISLENGTCTGITDDTTSTTTTPGVTPGTVEVVVTGARVGNSPKTLNVAVAKGDTPAVWAGKVRTAMDTADITTNFVVSGSDATIVLTEKSMLADDATLNISLDNGTCTGVTTAATSADTVAGVNGSGDAEVLVTSATATLVAESYKFAIAIGDAAADVATKLRTALDVAAITDYFDIGGTGADVTLTSKTYLADDATLVMTLDDDTCNAIAGPINSANTVAGVVGGDGDAEVLVTSATASLAAESYKFAIAVGDDAAAVAGKLRTALDVAAITDYFVVGGTGADVTLTSTDYLADDATLEMELDDDSCDAIAGPITSLDTVAGVASGAGDAEVIVTGNLVTGSPLAVAVAVAVGDDAAAIAGKIRTALNIAAITANYDVSGSSTAIVLTAKVADFNDTTLNIAIDNDTCSGITTAATSANTTPGEAYKFNTAHAQELMAGGVDPAVDVVANAFATVEAAIQALPEVATATGASAGNVTVEETVAFTGGGDNYAADTSATDLVAALLLDTAVTAIVTPSIESGTGADAPTWSGWTSPTFSGGGDNFAIATTADALVAYAATLVSVVNMCTITVHGADGSNPVEALAETPLASGLDKTAGTPAWFGRLATDGTDLWIAKKDSPEGETASVWLKIT